MHRLVALFALACLGPLSGAARAGVIDVPADAPTIADAVMAAQLNDTIRLAKGRYFESVATTKPLTFVGKPGAIWDGTFSGSSHSQLTVTADGVTVRNIEFQNGDTAITIAGADATVANCRFRAVAIAVELTGARATILRNRCFGTRDTSYLFQVIGPNARVERNSAINADGAAILVDAQLAGGATVIGNVLEDSQDYTNIEVLNAVAPKIVGNRLRNAYMSGAAILADNCDDALVSRNELSRINYGVSHGIRVVGARARVLDNDLRQLLEYNDDHIAIEVVGADAEVAKNSIYNCAAGEDSDTYGISITGARARVARNSLVALGGGGDETRGVLVSGDDATVDANALRDFNDEYTYGIEIGGARAVVTRNRISNLLYESSIYVFGNDYTVARNTVRDGAYNVYPIYLDGSATVPGNAVVEKNVISDIAYLGLYVSGNQVVLRGNRVRNVSYFGFEISGNDNRLEDNVVSGVGEDGFYISGNANTISRCVVSRAGVDGFDVGSGSGNVFDRCRATDCAAEGFDNGGGATVVTNCTFKRSRIDYAGNNNIVNDAGTTYGTGGPSTPPEVD